MPLKSVKRGSGEGVSRRFFIGGLASALAFGPRRIFAAPPGTYTGDRPALAFGLLSDVHVCLAPGGESLRAAYNTDTLLQAFSWFRDNGADAVVIAGDLAHSGLAGELKALADAWFTVFPGDKAPDGRHVERMFVFGNHDWSSPSRGKVVFPDRKIRTKNLLAANPKKWWDDIFHEEWTPFFEKSINGYPFIGAHWCNGGCNGKREEFTKGLKEYYAGRKGAFDPSRPFFHVQHPHPRGTVHGEMVWGQDDGVSTEILSAHPNAIAFSGHSHKSLTDERSIWQGAFTSIGCASLRNVSLTTSGVIPLEAGYENGRTPPGKDQAKFNALKAMPELERMNCRQGQFVRVYADRVVISRREFVTGATIGSDLVMPLPAAENKPFAFNPREAKAVAPEFPSTATLTVARAKGKMRGIDGKKVKTEVWKLTIPAATAVKAARTVSYEVIATGKDKVKHLFGVIFEGSRFPADDPRTKKTTVCRIACSRLPEKELTFEVRAVSCWGRKSSPLSAAV